MSEYQYYEFQVQDRQLTKEQIKELRQYSTRADITSSSFKNVYNWGDFSGKPEKLVEEYFDLFLYVANWGTRWFMLRVPDTLLDPEIAESYSYPEGDYQDFSSYLSCEHKGKYTILSFFYRDETGFGWEEGDGWLDVLSPIRTSLINNDHRALYLGWLLAVQDGEIEADTLEPVVPSGLGKLDDSLGALAAFLYISHDLITAAAEQSPPRPDRAISENNINDWISAQENTKRDKLLAELVGNKNSHLVMELQQQVFNTTYGTPPKSDAPRRKAGDLLERSKILSEIRLKKEADRLAKEKAEREIREAKEKIEREIREAEERKQYLKSITGKEESLWAKVEELVKKSTARNYDEATSLLQDLRDLDKIKSRFPPFITKLAVFKAKHERKKALLKRFSKAELFGPRS